VPKWLEVENNDEILNLCRLEMDIYQPIPKLAEQLHEVDFLCNLDTAD